MSMMKRRRRLFVGFIIVVGLGSIYYKHHWVQFTQVSSNIGLHESTPTKPKLAPKKNLSTTPNYFHKGDPFSSSGYENVCISDLVPNTKRTHESNFCLQLDLFKKVFETKETAISPEKQNKIILDILKKKVNERITNLQNPSDCSRKKLLVCEITTGFGFGSLMHLLGECFLIALGTNRIMVPDLVDYADLYEVITPLVASNCASRSIANVVEWKEIKDFRNSKTIDVVKIKIFEYKDKTFFPWNMPPSIAEPLQCCHVDPNAWWIGQIMKYFIKPKSWVEMRIRKAKERIGYSHPMVGVHVRRTDKYKETEYQYFESYMSHVIKWYDCNYVKKGISVIKKVYLATDDLGIVNEAKKKYPDFVFLHDPYIRQHSMEKLMRYSKVGVLGIATDIRLLKESDFFIGTYSSNVGRLVYELRQSEDGRTYDAVSLDFTYHYHRSYPKWDIAVVNHVPQHGEIELQIGDKISNNRTESTLITGFGINERTNSSGKYPMSKVRPYVNSIFYPGFT